MISPKTKRVVMASKEDDTEIFLFDIFHPSWNDTLHLSTDPTQLFSEDSQYGTPLYGTLHNGVQYIFLPMTPAAPDSNMDSAPQCRLSIDNVSRYMSPFIMSADKDSPSVVIKMVMQSSPTLVEMVWPKMQMTDVALNATTVEFTLTMDLLGNEPCPWLKFVPSYFPNLFT